VGDAKNDNSNDVEVESHTLFVKAFFPESFSKIFTKLEVFALGWALNNLSVTVCLLTAVTLFSIAWLWVFSGVLPPWAPPLPTSSFKHGHVGLSKPLQSPLGTQEVSNTIISIVIMPPWGNAFCVETHPSVKIQSLPPLPGVGPGGFPPAVSPK